MQLTFERNNLLQKFLNPVSKVAESCSVTLLSDKIQTVVASQDGGIILYAQLFNANADVKQETPLNFPNVRKLLQAFECTEDAFLAFKVESNHLAYSSPVIKFKYFLLDDGVIERSPLKTEKIDALTFQSGFKINGQKLNEIVRGASFTEETNKLYLSITDNEVLGELTDQTIQNTNSLTFKLTDKFVGNQFSSIPISMDVIRLVSSLKEETITVKVNTELKVVLFEVSDNDHKLKFIVSPLVK